MTWDLEKWKVVDHAEDGTCWHLAGGQEGAQGYHGVSISFKQGAKGQGATGSSLTTLLCMGMAMVFKLVWIGLYHDPSNLRIAALKAELFVRSRDHVR